MDREDGRAPAAPWAPWSFLGPDDRPAALRAEFEAAARGVSARLCLVLALLMAAVTAVYWPTDAWLLPDDAGHVAALARVRAGNLVASLAVAAGMWWSSWVRQRPVAWTAGWTMAEVAWASWTLAHAVGRPLPWEQAGYLVPLTGCALFLRLGPRIAWTVALGVVWSSPFVLVRWGEPRWAWATSPLFETFAVVVGVAIGHVMWSLVRENWYATREIAARGVQIAAADEARRNLFATLSHEVRTPLSLIVATLRRLGGEPPDPGGPAEVGLRSAHQMTWLLDQILELARLEAGPTARREVAVDLVGLLRHAVHGFAAAYRGERTVELDLEVAGLLLVGDATALSHMVHNLLGNAVKHTEAGGRVRVSLGAVDGWWWLQVEDDGDGVAAQDRERIFAPFSRAFVGRAALRRGTGIGLALVREVARVHGGEVEVVDGTLGGACFRVRAPHRRPAAESSGAAATERSDEQLALSRAFDTPAIPPREEAGVPDVVVVEDDPDLRAWLATALGATLRVRTAGDGEEALRALSEHPTAVVLTDLELPRMDGWALLAQVKADPALADVPVLVVSAQVDPQVRRSAILAGATDLIAKPFDPDELVAKVRRQVDARQVGRELTAREATLRREIEALRRSVTSTTRERRTELLARELHDGLGQSLASAALLLRASTLTSDPTSARARLDLVGELLVAANDALREALTELAPERLLRAGVPGLLDGLVTPLRAAGVVVSVEAASTSPARSDVVLAVYRTAQQALANVIDHGAGPVTVRWARDADGWALEVVSRRSPATDAPPRAGGSGLNNLTARAAEVGGRLSVDAKEDTWTVRLQVPESER